MDRNVMIVTDTHIERCTVDPLVLWHLIREGQKTAGKLPDYGLTESPQSLLAELRYMVQDDNSEVFVLVKDEKILGFCAVCVTGFTVSTNRVASVIHWYVRGAYRGSGGMKLLRAAKTWAKDNKCSHVKYNASALFGDMEKVSGFYERLGAKKIYQSYLQEI